MKRLLRVLALVGLIVLVPAAPTSADVCIAAVHVNPDTAPHGTVFKIKTPWADD